MRGGPEWGDAQPLRTRGTQKAGREESERRGGSCRLNRWTVRRTDAEVSSPSRRGPFPRPGSAAAGREAGAVCVVGWPSFCRASSCRRAQRPCTSRRLLNLDLIAAISKGRGKVISFFISFNVAPSSLYPQGVLLGALKFLIDRLMKINIFRASLPWTRKLEIRPRREVPLKFALKWKS